MLAHMAEAAVEASRAVVECAVLYRPMLALILSPAPTLTLTPQPSAVHADAPRPQGEPQ